MKGAKTHSIAGLNAILVPILMARFGVNLTPEEQVIVASVTGSVLMSVMRFASSGPDIIRQWIDNKKTLLSPAQLKLIVNLIDDRIRKSKGDSR